MSHRRLFIIPISELPAKNQEFLRYLTGHGVTWHTFARLVLLHVLEVANDRSGFEEMELLAHCLDPGGDPLSNDEASFLAEYVDTSAMYALDGIDLHHGEGPEGTEVIDERTYFLLVKAAGEVLTAVTPYIVRCLSAVADYMPYAIDIQRFIGNDLALQVDYLTPISTRSDTCATS